MGRMVASFNQMQAQNTTLSFAKSNKAWADGCWDGMGWGRTGQDRQDRTGRTGQDRTG